MLSTLTVMNNEGYAGPGSLRAEIAAASNGDTINFDPSVSGSVIDLASGGGELLLTKDLNIVGLGAANLAINCNHSGRAFEIAPGATDTISGLTIENGSVFYSVGGGILNFGTLTVSDCTLTGNSSLVAGGAIENSGTLTVRGSTLSGNNGGQSGGAIESGLSLTVTDASTISGNYANNGGGISNGGGSLTVSGLSTITANSAYIGGGIFGGTLAVTDSIVCGNSAPSGADIWSTGGIVTLTNSDVCIINQNMTTTTVTSSVSQSVLGQSVTYTASIYDSGPERFPGLPTGTVSFMLDGITTLGTVALNSPPGTPNYLNQVTLTTVGLPAGTHTITAIYSGDVNFVASTSAGLTQTVLSAQQELSAIVNQVTNLVTTGALSSQNANALIVKLNNAIVSLNSGNTITGVNQLDAFLNQTNAFLKSGKLDSIDALTLIADIDLAIAAALAKPI